MTINIMRQQESNCVVCHMIMSHWKFYSLHDISNIMRQQKVTVT